jgi:hypothetical protein
MLGWRALGGEGGEGGHTNVELFAHALHLRQE